MGNMLKKLNMTIFTNQDQLISMRALNQAYVIKHTMLLQLLRGPEECAETRLLVFVKSNIKKF